MTAVGLVAHSGGMGWDEALIFAVPVAILAVLQVLARRKARAENQNEHENESAGADEGDSGT